MKDYKDIENTRYIISREFSKKNTMAMLIEQRIKSIKKNIPTFENGSGMMYNTNGGSVQSKEGL